MTTKQRNPSTVCTLILLLAALYSANLQPARAMPRALDLTIYVDGLLPPWEEAGWSYGTTVELNHPTSHSGTSAIAVTHTEAYGALSLHATSPVNTAGYAFVEFWVYGAGPAGSALTLSSGDNPTDFYEFTAPPNVWTQYKAPLADLGNPAQIERLNWQDATGAAQPTYYVDDIRLLAVETPPAFPDANPDGSRSWEPGPSGVAVAPNGRVYMVVYQENRVYSWPSVAAMTGGTAPDKTFGSDGLGDPDDEQNGCRAKPTSASLLCGPESITVDANGNLYVADTYNHRVLIFYNPDTDGSPTTADKVLGQPDGDFTSRAINYDNNPNDEVVPGFCFVRGVAIGLASSVWVVDEFNYRVVRFNSPLTSDTLPDQVLGQDSLKTVKNPCVAQPANEQGANRFSLPLGVAVDYLGYVYVADLGNNRVQRFVYPTTNGPNADASYAGLNLPHDVAVDGRGHLYIADTGNNRVLAYIDGAAGDLTADHTIGGRNYPMGMAFTAQHDLLVADCGSPQPNSSYPPCVYGTRGVYLFKMPDAPTQPPTDTPTDTPPTSPTVTPEPGADVTLYVDAQANRGPISPYIYGMNEYAMAGGVAFMQELGLPVRRWGGNLTSRYNWQTDISNHGSDWFFANSKQSDAMNLPADSKVIRVIEQNRQAGADSFLVMPMSGYVANNNATACGFSVAKYGAQQATAAGDGRPDCGNGVLAGGALITNNDKLDASIAVNETWVKDWVAYLVGRYGAAANGGIRFYNLDNEPDLWFETHRDIRPEGLTFVQLRDLGYLYGAAIKQADPTALVLGPAVHGWPYYWHSPYDGQREDWATPDDRDSHGGLPLLVWYLQQMRAYEQQHGVRILDYLDIHYYPQGYLPGHPDYEETQIALNDAGSAARQANRLASTRSLWDPTYVDKSWIAEAGPDGGIVRLIPRMKAWIAEHYPGTKLAIGEYNWGGLEHINGALAQADVLGIFGREGVDLATLWEPPAPDQPGAYAFRIYRNYDGAGSRFGETRVQAISSDQGRLAVYAAQREGDKALTVVVINKTGSALATRLQLWNFAPGGPAEVYRYSSDNLNAIVRLADQPVETAGSTDGSTVGLTASFPANSITLLEIPGQVSNNPPPTPDPTEEPAGSRRTYLPGVQR
ncbi:MAG TPA: glycoside hydrolase family 44 protein [Caldilineaceae bacterium]|nr:glycoside hydrolase family 44 protein [Caldilineaceae bacterium]